MTCALQPANGKTGGRVGGKAASKPPPPDAALHERQVAAARELAALLGGSGGATPAAAPAGVDTEAAAAEYLAAVQASLQADVAYLKEVRVRCHADLSDRACLLGYSVSRLGCSGARTGHATHRLPAIKKVFVRVSI